MKSPKNRPFGYTFEGLCWITPGSWEGIHDGPPPPPVSDPLEIEKPSAEPVVRPPSKGVLRKSSYNRHACAA